MEIRQLRYLLAIAQCGSITKASELLRIAQPAIGTQIRNLEQELGVQLFCRHSRGSLLTDAGRLLVERAREIVEQVEEARTQIRGLAEAPDEPVSLGLTPTTSSLLVAPLLRRIQVELPKLRLSIVEEMSSVLTEWVASDRLTFAVASNSAERPGLRFEPVLEEQLYFVESARRGKVNGGTISFAEVAEHRLVMAGMPSSIRGILEMTAQGENLQLDIPYEVHSVPTIRNLVSQDLAASVLPYAAVRREVDAGELVAKRIVEPQVRRDLYFVSSSRRPISKSAHALKRLLQSLLRSEMQHLPDIWEPVRDRAEAIDRAQRRLPAGGHRGAGARPLSH